MWNGMEGIGWGWIGLGAVHMLLFWVLVIVGITALVRLLAGPRATEGPRESDAKEILKARYARGEITREQFDQMKRDISE